MRSSKLATRGCIYIYAQIGHGERTYVHVICRYLALIKVDVVSTFRIFSNDNA